MEKGKKCSASRILSVHASLFIGISQHCSANNSYSRRKKLKKMAEVTTDQKDQKDQKPSSEPAQAIWTLPSPAPSSPSHLCSTTQQWHIRDLETELTMWKECSKLNQEYVETLQKEIEDMNCEVQYLRLLQSPNSG